MYSNIHVLSSLENIIKMVIGEEIETSKFTVQITQPVKEKVEKEEIEYKDFKDENMKLVIQHEPLFMNVISAVKKIKPYMTMHVDNRSHLIFTLSSERHFPIVFIKFEIIYPMIQTSDINDIWFEFPILALTNVLNKEDKSKNQYILLIEENKADLNLKYISPLTKRETNLGKIVKIDKEPTLNEIFFGYKVHVKDEFKEDLGKSIDYEEMVNNMKVLSIIETPNFKNIEETKNVSQDVETIKRISRVLKINQKKIIMESMINENPDIITLCEGENDSNCIYWDESFNINANLKVFSFVPLFRGLDKLKGKSDFSYYVFCEWKTFEQSETTTFMLVKLLTNKRLEIDEQLKSLTFSSLISTGNIIFELFECYCSNNELGKNDQNGMFNYDLLDDIDVYNYEY